MNSSQRVRQALSGAELDRPAVGPLAVHYCARLAGVTLREYTTEPAVLADCVLAYYRRFRPDAVWLSADTWVNAQAMGAQVGFTGDDQPAGGCGPPCIRTRADVDRLPPPDPSRHGRWPLMLQALRRLRAALGDEVCLVACFDQYPFSLAAALMGLDQLMLRLVDDLPLVQALMERCVEYAAAYAGALAEAGADLLSGGDSPAGLIGPRRYREVALPFQRQLIAAIRARTSIPISLHICGDATPILADMAQTGADVLEIDHLVDIAEAARQVGPQVTLWGNLDPVGLLARGTPAEVGQATRQLREQMQASGHRRFVLSSGCTLPVETPPENLDALLAAARE
jgi:MtaA/CmuA family methyltransferase